MQFICRYSKSDAPRRLETNHIQRIWNTKELRDLGLEFRDSGIVGKKRYRV
ncbi:hypothetical protein D1BOALGB6SA_9958 [Olavius sp. associated proteobacterium Delta 1]|nr:hypothetical protein D1BOALGB6SA_9958 [Olavius sp. associated proteobacterium Delta 1]